MTEVSGQSKFCPYNKTRKCGLATSPCERMKMKRILRIIARNQTEPADVSDSQNDSPS
jgi:hypothetical protein